MADDIGNRHEQQIVVGGERRCVVERHHVARDAHEVGHDPDRTETGKTAQIDHCFGVAGSLQHAALSGPQREDVARTSEIIGGDLGAGQGSDGSSLIGRRGSGGVAIDEVDRNGECPTTGGFVLGDHELELELVCPIDRHRDADEAGHPTTQPHELLGVHELGGAGQSSRGGFGVIVDHHDERSGGDCVERGGDGSEVRHGALHRAGRTRRSTYLASTSASRLTVSPTLRWPIAVTAKVCGMIAMEKVEGVTAATVRLMPSTAMLLFDDIVRKLGRQREGESPGAIVEFLDRVHLTRAVDMTLNDMAAVAAVGGKWTFEVDRIAGRKTPEVRAIHRLGYGVGGPPVVTPLDDGQTAPVHGDRRPHLDVAEHSRRRNRHASALTDRRDRANGADLFDQTGEHRSRLLSADGLGQLDMRRNTARASSISTLSCSDNCSSPLNLRSLRRKSTKETATSSPYRSPSKSMRCASSSDCSACS